MSDDHSDDTENDDNTTTHTKSSKSKVDNDSNDGGDDSNDGGGHDPIWRKKSGGGKRKVVSKIEESFQKLWVDQYRPTSLNDFTFNLDAANTFKRLAQNSTDVPHLLVEGITGIGKKSMVIAYIKQCLDLYGLNGDEIYKTTNMEIELKYPNKIIELNIQKSLYHYNLNPSDYGIYDRHIVQDFLKTQFRYKRIAGFPYKTVIVRSAEKLSIDAQQCLRRTLENCIKNCRFIFVMDTQNQGNLIPALMSRCIHIRLGAPNKDEALVVVNKILNSVGVKINEALIVALFRKCDRNLTATLNLLQLIYYTKSSSELSGMINVNMADICPVTKCCNEIVTDMFSGDNLAIINKIRTKIYTLLTHGIRPEEIIKRIFRIAITNLPGMEPQIIELTNMVEFQLTKASREFYHVENYVVHMIILIKKYQLDPAKWKNFSNILPKLPLPNPDDYLPRLNNRIIAADVGVAADAVSDVGVADVVADVGVGVVADEVNIVEDVGNVVMGGKLRFKKTLMFKKKVADE
jgi:replication factor C subunit 3/5